MRTAETDQCVGGVTEAEERSTNFQIQIGLWRSSKGGLAQVENTRKEESGQGQPCRKQQTRAKILPRNRWAASPEKPADRCPTPHEIPQIPKKNGQLATN